MLIEGWRETAIGKKLLMAREQRDYTAFFTIPFTVDQRYVTPKILYDALIKSSDYELIGRFSYLNSKIEIMDTENNTLKRKNNNQ